MVDCCVVIPPVIGESCIIGVVVLTWDDCDLPDFNSLNNLASEALLIDILFPLGKVA